MSTVRTSRLSAATTRWLSRGLAVLGVALVHQAVMAVGTHIGHRWLLSMPMVIAPAVLVCAIVLRPWNLTLRLLQAAAIRFPGMALLPGGLLVLRQRATLCSALGWTVATGLALGVLNALPGWLAPRLSDTPLHGWQHALALAAAALLALPLGCWLHGMPRRWALARLTGTLDGAAVSNRLDMAANLLLVLALPAWLGYAIKPTQNLDLSDFWLPAAIVAWWGLYNLLRQLTTWSPRPRAALWLSVLPAPGQTQPRALLALAHQLAGRWGEGPVTLLLPADLPAGGEHLLAAEAAGRAGALFPTLPVQLIDWQATLPPAERWAALPLRELHLPAAWMADAASRLLQPADRLLVLAETGTDAALAAWQPLLRGRLGRVVQAEADRLPGSPAAAWIGHTTWAFRLKPLAVALLAPLRPGPAVGGTDHAGNTASDTTPLALPRQTAAAAGLPSTGLPAMPSLHRPALVAAAALVLLSAAYAMLAINLGSAADALVRRWDLLPPAAMDSTPQAVTATQDAGAKLRAALAAELTVSGLQITPSGGTVQLSLPSDGLFEPGSTTVKAASQPWLQRLGTALGETPGTLTVTAYIDTQTAPTLRHPTAISLTTARADAVVGVLRELLPQDRPLTAQGLGSADPVADNATAAGRATNRRVVIALKYEAPKTAATTNPAGASGASNAAELSAVQAAAPAADAAAKAVKK